MTKETITTTQLQSTDAHHHHRHLNPSTDGGEVDLVPINKMTKEILIYPLLSVSHFDSHQQLDEVSAVEEEEDKKSSLNGIFIYLNRKIMSCNADP